MSVNSQKLFVGIFWAVFFTIPFWLVFLVITSLKADTSTLDQYSDNQIADAIYWAEGGTKTKYPYGIKSTKPATDADCRRMCKEIISLHKAVYKERPPVNHEDFINYLSHSYCPVTSDMGKEQQELNSNWPKNVKFFLKHPKRPDLHIDKHKHN